MGGEATKYGCQSCCFRKKLHTARGALQFPFIRNQRLYKDKTNDAMAVVKFMQCLFTRFDACHSVISDRGTHIQRIFQ